VREFWLGRQQMFTVGLYQYGLLAQLFRVLRAVAGTDAAWLRRRVRESVEQRVRMTVQLVGSVIRSRVLAATCNSPILLAAQGINFLQRDRNVRASGARSMADVVVDFMARVATTDLERNWIVWYAIAGHFNHDQIEAVPPFLRPDRFERSRDAPTDVRFRPQNIFHVLGEAKPGTWSHYNFSDVIDWMPEAAQRRLLLEAHRTSQPRARLVYRSVEDACLVERLGLADKWRMIEPATTRGSAEERSRLYRRTNFYERVA
jgi:S-adenosylmethionine-diacylglycerol 3-amino-3-carboxypropyl transferase